MIKFQLSLNLLPPTAVNMLQTGSNISFSGTIHNLRTDFIYIKFDTTSKFHTKTKLRGFSPQANYTNWTTAAVGEVVPTFAGRGCYVVSAMDSHSR
jgi:hypothetical protein